MTQTLTEATASSDVIDRACAAVAQQVIDGVVDEHTGRATVLSYLVSSDAVSTILASFIRSRSAYGSIVDAVRAECERRLTSKMMCEDGTGADIHRFATGTAVGWARQYLRAVRDGIFANAMRSHHEDAVDPLLLPLATVEPVEMGEVHHLIRDWISEAPGRSRTKLRARRSAMALRMSWGLPPAVRPDYRTRHRLLATVDSDPRAAWVSAADQLSTIREGSRGPFTHPELMALWDDYTVEALACVVEHDEQAAHLIAKEALEDYLRLSAADMKRVRGRVRSMVSTRVEAEVSLAALEVVLAAEFSTQTLFSGAHPSAKATTDELDHQRTEVLAGAQSALSAAVGTPLGDSADEVYESLMQVVTPYVRELNLAKEFGQFHQERMPTTQKRSA